jgi:ATP phosphoribosyltransferase regulatory subunit
MPLLPSGLQDSLSPTAKRDRIITNALLDRFSLFGYEQVSPPLLEFEETLLSNKGEAHQNNSFRVMDNFSQALMAIRSDITPQIERIALSQINNNTSTPVRLCYAGQVLRMKPAKAGGKRQLRQAGLELIGTKSQAKAEEVLYVAIEALQLLGLDNLVVSVAYGNLLPDLISEVDTSNHQAINKAIHHKNSQELPSDIAHLELIKALMNNDLELAQLLNNPATSAAINNTQHFIKQMQKHFAHNHLVNVAIHADILDVSDFPYHDGLCFTILDKATRLEIGRGGCYHLANKHYGCGVTLYVDNLLGTSIAAPNEPQINLLNDDKFFTDGKKLRDTGEITVLQS